MTIGQRIAECRKQLGLSQEALGEKMGVSRQAISKWEADAALPEIDKLIGLSKLFGVSVGWLLGVEDKPEEKDTLTEEQLDAMEQLVRTYAAPAQPEKKESRKPLILSAAALALSAVTLLTCLTHHNNLSNSLGSMSYQMVNLQSGYDTVRAKINDLETAQTAPETPSALHWFEFQLTPDPSEPKVTVQLSAVPKEQTAGITAAFTVRREGAEIASADCIFDGTAYIADVELPTENGYEYWLVLRNRTEGVQQQIPLEDDQAENLAKSFHLTCEIREPGHLIYQDNELMLMDFEVALTRPESLADGAVILWDCVEVLLAQNGEVIGRNVLISEEDDVEFRRSFNYEFSHYALSFPEVQMENGDGVEIWVKATLSNGMECLEMVNSWGYEDGIFYGGELTERVNED